MPRKNNPIKQKTRESSRFDAGFRPKCRGCAFAGSQFKCMASDGCLRSERNSSPSARPPDGGNRNSPKP